MERKQVLRGHDADPPPHPPRQHLHCPRCSVASHPLATLADGQKEHLSNPLVERQWGSPVFVLFRGAAMLAASPPHSNSQRPGNPRSPAEGSTMPALVADQWSWTNPFLGQFADHTNRK